CSRHRIELRNMLIKSEIRMPKSETKPNPFGFRISDFFRISAFGFRSSLYTVPMPPSRRDKLRPQLFAQIRHVHIEQIRERAVILVKQMFIKRGAGNHLTPEQREEFQQRV